MDLIQYAVFWKDDIAISKYFMERTCKGKLGIALWLDCERSYHNFSGP